MSEAQGATGAPTPIVRRGSNAWRVENASRAAVLVDAAQYFGQLRQVLPRARRSIWILGWDFSADISLDPADPGAPALGTTLRRLVEENADLVVRVLVWGFGDLYSQKKLRHVAQDWLEHPRIRFVRDHAHPLRASHHQKIVCIDGHLAFAGGIDLTVKRWDTPEHRFDNAARTTPDGIGYGPVHDVQMIVEGDAARALQELAAQRWRAATGDDAPLETAPGDLWPEGLAPEFRDIPVAIARTRPPARHFPERREVAELNAAAIRAAQRSIYVETQYFASSAVARLLEKRLAEPDGPEIVVVVTSSARGMIERFVMGGNRDRLIRRLRRADHAGRFMAAYAVVPDGEGEQEVLIHSKVITVDNRFLRVGSSNLNNRSEGLDTECDLAIEAGSGDDERAIAAVRTRLLAEHLDVAPEALERAVAAEGSLLRAIRKLNAGRRGLRSFEVSRGGTRVFPGTGWFDPKRPYWPLQWLVRLFRLERAARLSPALLSGSGSRLHRLPPPDGARSTAGSAARTVAAGKNRRT